MNATRETKELVTFELAFSDPTLQRQAERIAKSYAAKLRYVGVFISVEDYVQVGFLRVLQHYRTTNPVTQIPYLMRVLENGIIDQYRKDHPVPKSLRAFMARYFETKEWLSQKNGYESSDSEVAAVLGISVSVLQKKLNNYLMKINTSFESQKGEIADPQYRNPRESEESEPYASWHTILPEDMPFTLFVSQVREALELKRTRYRHVFDLLMEHKSQSQIAKEIGITESAISRIVSEHIRKTVLRTIDKWQNDKEDQRSALNQSVSPIEDSIPPTHSDVILPSFQLESFIGSRSRRRSR